MVELLPFEPNRARNDGEHQKPGKRESGFGGLTIGGGNGGGNRFSQIALPW